MRVCTVLLLFLLLCEGLPGVTAKNYTAVEGEDVTVNCSFTLSGSKIIFCKNDCDKEEDILVETSENSHENGRYSIRYEGHWFAKNIITVSIKKVQMSDSGQYRCKLDRLITDGCDEFWIEVTKAKKKPTPPKPPLTTSTTAVSTVQGPGPGTTQSPGPGPTSGTSGHLSPDTSTAVGSPLYVGLTLAVILVLFSVALMIFYCSKRKNKPKQRPVNTESAEVQECDPEYEEIPEEQVQDRSTDCGSVIYSLVSAPDHTQTENLVDPVHYSEVEFSRNSAPHSRTEAVVYSAVRTKETLYSTVSKPQQ